MVGGNFRPGICKLFYLDSVYPTGVEVSFHAYFQKIGKFYLIASRVITESFHEWMQIKMNSIHVTTENIMLIQRDTNGRCNIGMGLAKLKNLKPLGMIEEQIETYSQMLGSVSKNSGL